MLCNGLSHILTHPTLYIVSLILVITVILLLTFHKIGCLICKELLPDILKNVLLIEMMSFSSLFTRGI